MLPVWPLAAPIFGLLFVLPFAIFAAAIWAVPMEEGRLRWLRSGENSPDENWPLLQIAGVIGTYWAFRQGQSYAGHDVGWPFFIFWNVFSAWFAVATLLALPTEIRTKLAQLTKRLLGR